jgi:MFS family permease
MDKNRNVTGLVIGAILIVIGILSLFGNFFSSMNWDNLWPLIIVGIGAAFFIGMTLGDKTQGGLAVPGSILVTIGLILFVLNSTDRWEAWSYTWALIICGVGIGTLINGYWSDRPNLRKQGLNTIRAGLILFLIFGVIMEFIFSITGVSPWGNLLLWAILLALLGLYLLITRLLRLGKAEGERVDLFWPILMIGVGVVASLAYLGWLPKENLWMLVNLWPLLLIVAGLGVLLRSRSSWVGAVLGVLVVAVIFVAAFAGEHLGLKSEPTWPFEIGSIQIGDFTGERITGSGNVITENRPVSGFDHVRMEISGNLEIQQGASESLTVSGEDNILPLLATDVSGSELVIKFKPFTNIKTNRPIQINLTTKNLKELDYSSSGKVTIKPITTGDFRLTLSSSGDVEIEEIQADKITANLSSSGDIRVKGNARQLDLQLSSSGSFQAGDLQVQDAIVRLTSSGDVTVWVVEDLEVRISSSGNVTYYGNPSINQSITSSGDLISKGPK